MRVAGEIIHQLVSLEVAGKADHAGLRRQCRFAFVDQQVPELFQHRTIVRQTGWRITRQRPPSRR